MNENKRHAALLFARDLVEDLAVLPLERTRFATKRCVFRLVSVAPDARIDSSERRHASRARADGLPELAELDQVVSSEQ